MWFLCLIPYEKCKKLVEKKGHVNRCTHGHLVRGSLFVLSLIMTLYTCIYIYMYSVYMYMKFCLSIKDVRMNVFVVAESCAILYSPRDCSMPDLSVLHQLPKFAQVPVHCISDAIQPSHPLTSSSPSALNLSQHQGLFQWVSCSHQITKILEFQLKHQYFRQMFRVDFP